MASALAQVLLASTLLSAARGLNPDIAYDGRSMILSGERQLLLSGSIHYARVHPGEWGAALDMLKDLGLNTVQTYAMWAFHQANATSEWTWEGWRDLPAFLQLAVDRGLNIVLRIGPYVCGEWSGGGIPLFMRDSGAACYRCSDPVWEAAMARALAAVVNISAPYFYPAQGKRAGIIDLQVENEYDGPDMTYLNWAVDTARGLTTAVPWSLCHDELLCAAVNNGTTPGGKVLCTINGFWEEQRTGFIAQPSPVWVATQRKNNPGQPLLWTEDQAWFNQFGEGHRVRHANDQSYGIARWFAYGGTGHNHYMVTGGNNYGLTAGFSTGPVATAYAPDAVIDSFLLRHEPRYSFYRALYTTLSSYASDLLGNAIPDPQPLGVPGTEAHVYGRLAFLSNFNATAGATVTFGGRPYALSNWTVLLVDTTTGGVLFNTSALDPAQEIPGPPSVPPPAAVGPVSGWSYYAEPGVASGVRSVLTPQGHGPLEQMRLTGLDLTGASYTSDYAVYSTDVPASVLRGAFAQAEGDDEGKPLPAPPHIYISSAGNEAIYVFLDGQPVPAASSTAWRVGGPAAWPTLPRPAAATTHTLSVLAAAMGITNVDPSPTTAKGVRNATVDGVDVSLQPWNISWLFPGEAAAIFTPEGVDKVSWTPVAPGDPSVNASVLWFRATFDRPRLDPTANETAYALNLTGLVKGQAWVNGFHLGRYDLQPGGCPGGSEGSCAPPNHGPHCYEFWFACGKPTQSLYHVPAPVLMDSGNLVAVFEETAQIGGTAPRDLSTVQLVALHGHPPGGG